MFRVSFSCFFYELLLLFESYCARLLFPECTGFGGLCLILIYSIVGYIVLCRLLGPLTHLGYGFDNVFWVFTPFVSTYGLDLSFALLWLFVVSVCISWSW